MNTALVFHRTACAVGLSLLPGVVRHLGYLEAEHTLLSVLQAKQPMPGKPYKSMLKGTVEVCSWRCQLCLLIFSVLADFNSDLRSRSCRPGAHWDWTALLSNVLGSLLEPGSYVEELYAGSL